MTPIESRDNQATPSEYFPMLRISAFCLGATLICPFVVSVTAEQTDSAVVFEDRFDTNPSGEDTEEVGNDWKLNTKEGHQFVLKDGGR